MADIAEDVADLSLAAVNQDAAAVEGLQEEMRRRRHRGGRRRRGKKLSAQVQDLVTRLDLAPHPEGGFFRETFRDVATVGGTSRAASTAILYLLPAGAKSSLHRIDASECWHAYLGGPIEVVELDAAAGPDGVRTTVLGINLAAGQQLQHVVPPGVWFGAAPCEGTAYALVGCTVAPGFEFSKLEMGDAERLKAEFPSPAAAAWIDRLLAAPAPEAAAEAAQE